MSEQIKQVNPEQKKHWYDRYYEIIRLIPIVLLILSIFYLYSFNSKNGDFVLRDTSLAGGTTITLLGDIDETALEAALKLSFSDVYVRQITDFSTGQSVATLVDSSASPEELKVSIESHLGYELNSQNSSIEFTGPSLSEGFYKQLIIALIISFILMSIVVSFLFRSFVPSIAIIFAALADIIFAVTLTNLVGLRISAAGIAAFLMLIGYSVDTDILLTTRVLKKGEGSINSRIYSSFKTGIFMTLTALVALLPAFFIITGLPDSFRQIFLIATFGLLGDIVNTWMVNTGILKWYAEKKGLH